MVDAKQIPKEQNIFNQIWTLFKKYYDEPNTDETWESFINDVNKVCHDNNNSFLARKLGIAILETKEEMVKKNN